MKILLIEDDAETAQFVADGLSGESHDTAIAANGAEGLHRAMTEAWDLLIVDRMLPQLDGLTLVSKLREAGTITPILFLTTLGGVDDRVHGLNAGADDYLVKPFSFAELLARVAALGRRRPDFAVQTVLAAADLEVNLLTRTVTRAGVVVDLLPREFLLLEYLLKHVGPDRDPHHAARECVGRALRSQYHSRRDAYQPPTQQDRPRSRHSTHPYRTRRRIHAQCCELGSFVPRAFDSRS